MNKSRTTIVLLSLVVAVAVLLPLAVLSGSVRLSLSEVWQTLCGHGTEMTDFIVLGSRLPAAVTALCAGASLAVAGLLMQTSFDNPLAGPSIMGISSGANLGVAIVMLAGVPLVSAWGTAAVVVGAFVGAMAILLVLLALSSVLRSSEVLLIVGILIGYLASSAISLLNFFAPERAVHGFVMWGMGNFNGVTTEILPVFAAICAVLCIGSALYIKSLNAMLFGADYARSVGLSVGRVRAGVLFISGALTAVVTAWCGPIGFIGLAVPHIARMLVATSNHRAVLPATILSGAVVGLLCQVLSSMPSQWYAGQIPINAITPLIGVPVIAYVLFNRRKLLYFN
ncbi:MAG: iron ABC transporter permease [Muribaculaceae bacterium]|nr:iron ABC transporter permease [Muribaculaceae bacterium]